MPVCRQNLDGYDDVAKEPLEQQALKDAGLEGRPVELFFFPLPSVQDLRDAFQEKIGWKQ